MVVKTKKKGYSQKYYVLTLYVLINFGGNNGTHNVRRKAVANIVFCNS